MPNINIVKKARKDQGECHRCGAEIRAGDMYFWVQLKLQLGGIRKNFCASHQPRPSEMTTSDKKANLYGAQEAAEDTIGSASTLAEIIEALQECASTANDVAQEYRDSVDNMPEGLQQGSVAEDLLENADSLEDWAQELEDVAGDIEGMDEEDAEDVLSDAQSAAEGALGDIPI